jgi:hypothetical protein
VTFKEIGILFPNNVITPNAKAISVAVGIAHPLIVTAFPKLKLI